MYMYMYIHYICVLVHAKYMYWHAYVYVHCVYMKVVIHNITHYTTHVSVSEKELRVYMNQVIVHHRVLVLMHC